MSCRDDCNQGRKPCPCPEVCSAPDFICEWEYVLALVGSLCDAAKKYGPRIALVLACAALFAWCLAR